MTTTLELLDLLLCWVTGRAGGGCASEWPPRDKLGVSLGPGYPTSIGYLSIANEEG